MVPDASTPSPTAETRSPQQTNPLIYALIGGIAGIVLSFLPLSTMLGGALAGYLDGRHPSDGLKIGAIAGCIMLIPFTVIGFVILFLIGVTGAPLAFGILGFFIFLLATLYTVGLSALGGYIGSYLQAEEEFSL